MGFDWTKDLTQCSCEPIEQWIELVKGFYR